MKRWSILALIAIFALLMPVSTAGVSAQDELSLSKSADLTSAALGDTITYTYTITNTDNVTIENIYLEDDPLGIINLGGQTSLGAGENITATTTHTVVGADLPGPLVNTANVTGTDPNGNPISASASASVDLNYTASLQLTKTADPTSATPGITITYTYTITNNGDVTIDDIALEDDPLGIIDLGGQTSLGAGENIMATTTYTVVEADLPGPLVNTANVTGTDPDSNLFADNDTATVELSYNSELQVNKEADRETAAPREVITYTYTITNTGNMAIGNVTLEDDRLGPISLGGNGNIMLAPGQSVSANATYTVSIWDFLRSRTIVNTANVTGNDSLGNSLTGSDTATVSLTIISKAFLTKFEILKLSGVPGKGIEKAPGLQKPFNPNSQAAEHAGKKGNPETPEQLQAEESVENQGTEQQLQITSEVQNEAGGGQATQNDDEAGPGKGQLKKNWSSDNQTQLQEATQGNGRNKPDKDKPNKKSKQGK